VTDTAKLLAIAQEAVEIGYRLIRNASEIHVREKGDRDLVTEVDLAVEREVRAFLEQETPEIGFLGEENGGQGLAGTDSLVWTLDPIDGTSNFAHGIPLCAVSLGLVSDGESIVAAIVAPFLELRYHGVKGEGAFSNGKRITASQTADLAKAIVSIGDYAVGADAAEKNEKRLRLTALLAELVERVRMFGTAALDLAWVGEGRTDAAIILANKPWDTAAGVLIAREAGATVLDEFGDFHTFNSKATIAISPGITSAIMKIVADMDN
jgi:myo-inositol-1(or 4)-monophosphatase